MRRLFPLRALHPGIVDPERGPAPISGKQRRAGSASCPPPSSPSRQAGPGFEQGRGDVHNSRANASGLRVALLHSDGGLEGVGEGDGATEEEEGGG